MTHWGVGGVENARPSIWSKTSAHLLELGPGLGSLLLRLLLAEHAVGLELCGRCAVSIMATARTRQAAGRGIRYDMDYGLRLMLHGDPCHTPGNYS